MLTFLITHSRFDFIGQNVEVGIANFDKILKIMTFSLTFIFFIGYTVTDESLDETQCLANTSVFHHTHFSSTGK